MKARIHQSFSARMFVQDSHPALCLLGCTHRAPANLSGLPKGDRVFSAVEVHDRKYALFWRSASRDQNKGLPTKVAQNKSMNNSDDNNGKNN